MLVGDPASTWTVQDLVNRFVMSSGSMEPTLHEGDIVVTDGGKFNCPGITPRIGDVVVYLKTNRNNVRYMHRVVAGPGSTVQMVGGRLFVDGKAVQQHSEGVVQLNDAYGEIRQAQKIRETLSNGASFLTLDLGPHEMLDDIPWVLLGDGQWFLMGDNRDNAVDSRIDGPVMTSSICGNVLRISESKDPARVGLKP